MPEIDLPDPDVPELDGPDRTPDPDGQARRAAAARRAGHRRLLARIRAARTGRAVPPSDTPSTVTTGRAVPDHGTNPTRKDRR